LAAIERHFLSSPFVRYFLLSMSLQPWYNLIEINPSRSAVSLQDKQEPRGRAYF
jgi:hypothetical protein